MNETFLTFHIGSSFVGATLVKREKGISRIIFSKKEEIPKMSEVNADKLWQGTLTSLDVLLRYLFKQYHFLPSKIFCTLSSPWYVSELRTIELKKNTSFLFDLKLANELLQKEVELFQKDHLIQENDFKNDLVPIEMKIMKTSLNGYVTSRPFGQKVTELTMDIFFSMATKNIQNEIKETVCRFYSEKEIKFSSFAFSSFALVRDMFSEKDFLFLSVDGEVTDVSLVKDGGFVALSSFPVGSNFLLRKTAVSLECSLSEALSLISLYREGHAGVQILRKMEANLREFEKEWLQEFEKCLGGFLNGISIPHTVFLTTEEKTENIFSQMVQKERIHQYDWTWNKFKVTQLPREMLQNLSHNKIVC